MPKKLLCSLVALLLLLQPVLGFAAFDDATLTTDTVISFSDGLSLNIYGTSAAIESITVGASSFDVVLLSGSSIIVESSGRRTFGVSPGSGAFTSVASCEASRSTLTLTGTGSSVTVTVTPESTVCSGGTGTSSGGADPFAKPYGPLSISINSGATTTTSRQVSLSLEAGSNVKSMAISRFSNLSESVLVDYRPTMTFDLCGTSNACADGTYTIYARFHTFFGEMSEVISDTIVYKKSMMEISPDPFIRETPQFMMPLVSAVKFSRTLKYGTVGADVKWLQQMLNSNGVIIANTGPGSPGNETNYFGLLTQTAVQKFQAKYNIVSSGSPRTTGYGLVGPKTRVKLNELF